MLIEFSVGNWRSIKSKQTLSFVKTAGNELSKTNCFKTDFFKHSLLKSAAIYGPNAGGKSNFLKAIEIVEDIVLRSAKNQHGDQISVEPFLLDKNSCTEPSEFELIFIASGIRYQYGFLAVKDHIVEEWLFAFPKGVAQKWLERIWQPDTQTYAWFNSSSFLGALKQKRLWQDSTRKNALFLSTAVQLNCTQLQPVFDWFNNTLRVNTAGHWPTFITAKLFKNTIANKNVLDFLKAADLGICNLSVESEKFSVEYLPKDMPDELKKRVLEDMKDKDVFNVKTFHRNSDGKLTAFDLDEESDGTQKYFDLAGPWLYALNKGHVLVVDELNDNLHPKLVRFLVQLFNNDKTNPKGAQLLFTTHETSILDQNLLRRDQIWFSQKNEDQSTFLTQLREYKVIKGRENIEAYYLAGQYGALPYIGDFNIEFEGKASNGE